MAIVYPISLPTAPGFVRSRLVARTVVGVSASIFTGEQQTYRHQGEWWEFEAALPVMLRAQAEAWIAALTALFGRHGTFLFGDPDGKTGLGTFTGAPLVNGTGQAGNTLATDGWTAGSLLKAGNYIQIGTGTATRLYKILADATATGGAATLDIFPRLRESPADNAPIAIASCRGTFRLTAPFEWSADELHRYAISFSGIEAI